MSNSTHTQDDQGITSERGRWYVTVPWGAAENVRAYLERQGLCSTVCLDPEAHQARLELWPGVSPDAVRAALRSGPAGGAMYPSQTAA
jgi:hypothetical protein